MAERRRNVMRPDGLNARSLHRDEIRLISEAGCLGAVVIVFAAIGAANPYSQPLPVIMPGLATRMHFRIEMGQIGTMEFEVGIDQITLDFPDGTRHIAADRHDAAATCRRLLTPMLAQCEPPVPASQQVVEIDGDLCLEVTDSWCKPNHLDFNTLDRIFWGVVVDEHRDMLLRNCYAWHDAEGKIFIHNHGRNWAHDAMQDLRHGAA